MNCSTTNLVNKSKTGITPADIFNFDPNPPKTRKSTKSNDGFSKGRQRNFNSHNRQLVLQELYNCGYDVTNLEIGEVSEPTKKPKRRFTPRNRGTPKRRLETSSNTNRTQKRRKKGDEDPDEMELEDKL